MWPLILAAALMAGSTIANDVAAGKQARARSAALSAQRTRNRMLDQESQALQAQSQSRYANATGDMAEREKTLGDYLTQYGSDVSAPSVMPASTSNITVSDQAGKTAAAKAFTGQQAQSQAKLRSFGDALGAASRGMAGDMSQLGVLQGFRQGDQDALGLELAAAQQRGAKSKFLGDLLAAGGQMAMMYGLNGAPNPNAGSGASAGR